VEGVRLFFIWPWFDPRQRQRIFPLTSASRPAQGPTQPPVQWVPGALSPGVKRGRGVMLTTHPLLVPRLRKYELYLLSPAAPSWRLNKYGTRSSRSTVVPHIVFTLNQVLLTVEFFLLFFNVVTRCKMRYARVTTEPGWPAESLLSWQRYMCAQCRRIVQFSGLWRLAVFRVQTKDEEHSIGLYLQPRRTSNLTQLTVYYLAHLLYLEGKGLSADLCLQLFIS
jgi:hypothetical protein